MDDITEEDIREIQNYLAGSSPDPKTSHNVHTFLNNVAVAKDTTKTGYLRDDDKLNEVGIPKHPVRTYKELELFCNEVADMGYFGEYFRKKAEILTSTSLSRDGKLLTLAVLQKREIADTTVRRRKKNKGWFRKKDDEDNSAELSGL